MEDNFCVLSDRKSLPRNECGLYEFLNNYRKIAETTATKEDISETADFIKNRFSELENVHPKDKDVKRLLENKDRSDDVLAIDRLVHRAHTGGSIVWLFSDISPRKFGKHREKTKEVLDHLFEGNKEDAREIIENNMEKYC